MAGRKPPYGQRQQLPVSNMRRVQPLCRLWAILCFYGSCLLLFPVLHYRQSHNRPSIDNLILVSPAYPRQGNKFPVPPHPPYLGKDGLCIHEAMRLCPIWITADKSQSIRPTTSHAQPTGSCVVLCLLTWPDWSWQIGIKMNNPLPLLTSE